MGFSLQCNVAFIKLFKDKIKFYDLPEVLIVSDWFSDPMLKPFEGWRGVRFCNRKNQHWLEITTNEVLKKIIFLPGWGWFSQEVSMIFLAAK